MSETIKVRWLVDHEQTKVAPKTLSTQILNEDGTQFKDTVESAIATHASDSNIHVTAAEKEAWNNIEVPSLDGYATEEYVENLYKKLNSNTVLGFYCIEDVTIVTNGTSKVYPANSNIEIAFIEDDVFEIIPTSDNSILSLSAFPGALGTYYPWLEGVAQFSNILFDMNAEDMYTKWSQGNQGAYHVQRAQYTNCIFWSDNPYISDVSKRTNYTLTHTSQLPLCYSTIPDNTFKSFYLAGGVVSDPNWSNPAYTDSFAKATWATQVFSYYGARTVGLPGMFDIVLPKDCRGLMFDARNIENAGTFNAVNVTNFGAKSGSWREAFGDCTSLRRLYIKNLKVSLNISWSPVDYNSISYIISAAANTNKITIYVSPYTYNLLSQDDFDLATSKNITIALLATNYVEDKRLSAIADKADKTHTHSLNDVVDYMVDSELSDTSTNPVQNKAIKIALTSYETKEDAQLKFDEAKEYTNTKTSGMTTETVVDNKISAHNTSIEAHNDIRDMVTELTTRVNNFLDVDDTTADQLSEVLELIENNKGTLESLTSSKVNVSDIVDNLTTANASKVLSANQGVALKALIDTLQEAVDGKAASIHSHAISEVTGLQDTLDEKATQTALNTHTGDTTVHVTADERTAWNAIEEKAKTYTDEQVSGVSDNLTTHVDNADIHFTADERTKLSGIAEGANRIEVDSAFSSTSENPVANKVVNSAISEAVSAISEAVSAISANTSAISANTSSISTLQAEIEAWEEITSEEVRSLFA